MASRKGEDTVMFGTRDGGWEYAKPNDKMFGGRKAAGMPSTNKGVPKGSGKGIRAPGPNIVKNNPFAGGGTYRNK